MSVHSSSNFGQSGKRLRLAHKSWEQGVALTKQGKWAQAVRSFEHACDQSPQDGLFRVNLARALMREGRLVEAIDQCRSAIAIDPSAPMPRQLLAKIHCEHGDYSLAADCMLANLDEVTPSASYLQDLGNALFASNRYREAVTILLRALPLDVTHASTHYRLGAALNALGMKEQAIECLLTAIALGAGEGTLACHSLLAFICREMCRWEQADEHIQIMQAMVASLPDDAELWVSAFASVTITDDMDLQFKAERSCARFYARGKLALPPLPVRPLPQRLRVGFVSSDFHHHATTLLMAQLLEQIDRERFEITLYSHGHDDGSDMRRRIVAAADHFVEVGHIGDREVAARVRSDAIDVLVDLKGYTVNCRTGIFAHRPAPVQVSYLGFAGSSGADYIDYFIGDAIVTPISHARHYSEKLAHMPHCYQPNDRLRPLPKADTRLAHGLPEDALVLCGFNQPFKLSAQIMDAWCSLLTELPNAVLWLLAWNDLAPQLLRQEAKKRGIDPARLVFAPKVPIAQHISRFALADLYLDTWPCNGHTTASDALWAGVPVVTWKGETFASRVASSLLCAVGMPELVCDSLAQYLDLARNLACDHQRRGEIRQALVAARDAAPLFDSQAYARDFGDLLWRMARRWEAGQPPAHLLGQ